MNRPPPHSDDGNELERSLERGLRHQPLSAGALARMRANLLAEFRQQTPGVIRRRRRQWVIAVAVTLSALAVGILVINSSYWLRDTAVVQLESTTGGGVLTVGDGSGRTRVEAGGVLHPFERWDTRGAALARLLVGGTLRLAPGTVVQAVDPRTLALTSGRAYFDFPPGSGSFVLHTSVGTIEHVGTQFEVMQSESGVRVRVREGSVLLRGDRRVLTINTGAEVLVDREGRIQRSAYPPYGDDWEWVESVAPSYEIENRPLAEFLTWVGRETGRHITFVDARAREVANRTMLHGSVKGMRPMEALDQVLSTTSLRFELQGGEIRIASRS